VAVEIRPEPSAEERAVLLEALRELEEGRPPLPGEAWRLAALDDHYAETVRPRTSPGAARA
jgi:hypothetical protein